MGLQDTYTLNDGVEIPIIGFGTWKLDNDQSTADLIEHAIDVGYRHIDTASTYGNEESVGLGIKQAIDKGLVTREELFVTTKLWNDDQTYDLARKSIDDSLARLGLDYVDLYLIHWPNPAKYRDNWQEANAESWRAMEEGHEAGKIRSLGVSNFMPRHLKPLLESANIMPTVNQLYLNPSDTQPDAVAENKKHNILSEAYSPLGTGDIFKIDELSELAKKYNKTEAQIVLRWSLQRGFLPIPKTATMSRVAENADLFDFELNEDDMVKINAFKGLAGTAQDPDVFPR